MSYTYDITTSKKDNKANICLFSCHTISGIVNLFVSTFLVAYIYQFCDDVFSYIFNVGLYNIATYVSMAIVYFFVAKIVDKTNRVWIYRLGLVLRAGLVVLVVFCGKDIAKMLLLAGVLCGVSEAFYYASYNVLKQEMVSRKSMKTFATMLLVFGRIVDVIVPIIMGTLISVSTYAQVSIYVLVICAVQVGLSFGVKSKKPTGSSYSIKEYFEKLKQKPEVYSKMKFMYMSCFVYGFTTIGAMLINICIMTEIGSDFSLGALTSIFSLVSIITILLVNKFTKAGKRSWMFIVSGILPVITSAVFAIWPSVTTLIIYFAGMAISKIIYQVIFDIYRNGTLKQAGLYSEISEHQTLVELLFNSSRTISYAILMILGICKNFTLFKVFLVIFALGYTATLLLIGVYEKKYLKTTETEQKTLETNL